MDGSLVVFSRFPRLGRVKTRLEPALGKRGCLELHRALLLDTIERTRFLCRRHYLYLGDSTSRERARFAKACRLPADLIIRGQTGADLGERSSWAPTPRRCRGTTFARPWLNWRGGPSSWDRPRTGVTTSSASRTLGLNFSRIWIGGPARSWSRRFRGWSRINLHCCPPGSTLTTAATWPGSARRSRQSGRTSSGTRGVACGDWFTARFPSRFSGDPFEGDSRLKRVRLDRVRLTQSGHLD